jgi:hypothetical protein
MDRELDFNRDDEEEREFIHGLMLLKI